MSEVTAEASSHFIHEIIEEDIKTGKWDNRVVTRFPPEPNGYLHIGHAKSICLNFTTAAKYGGLCHMRFDDTNPVAEEQEYVDAILKDVKWLGFDWGEHLYFASDYFEQMYDYAVALIKKGGAYVCDLDTDTFKEYRGVPTRPGKESPNRNRPIEESLRLFEEMRDGKHPDGSLVLRAKIDMSSPNLHLRDPAMYRIKHASHHRTGDKWSVYPMYDWAHGIEDSIERITHSICTLEFEVHRPLYDWFLDQLDAYHPQQVEFARLNLNYTVMSKRKLLELVEEGHVAGWSDPRMPTISGMRRRGYPADAIRAFCEKIGVTKFDSLTDMALLEHCVRDILNKSAERRMAVLRPLKLVIDNYPEEAEEEFEAMNNPEDPSAGKRKVPFTRELYIEQDDFMEDPPKKFFRLAPGREVRLRCACLFTCTDVVKDSEGRVIEVHGTYDQDSRGGTSPDGRKVKGTIHWVSAKYAIPTPVRLYDRLFTKENPADEKDGTDWKSHVNPDSLQTITAQLEPSLMQAKPGESFQFERLGYFCADEVDSVLRRPIFNRTCTLRDSWAKVKKG